MHVKQAVFAVLASASLPTVFALPDTMGSLQGVNAERDELAARKSEYLDPVSRAVAVDERINVEVREPRRGKKPKTSEAKASAPATKSEKETTTSVAAAKPTTTSSIKEESTTTKAPSSSSTAHATTATSSSVAISSAASSSALISSTASDPATSSSVAISSAASSSALISSTASDPAITSSEGVITSITTDASSEALATTASSSTEQDVATQTTSDATEETQESDPGSGTDWTPYIDQGVSLLTGYLESTSTSDIADYPTDSVDAATGNVMATTGGAGAAGAVASSTVDAAGIVPSNSMAVASGTAGQQVTGVPNARRAWAQGLPRFVETTFITSTTTAPAGTGPN